MGAAVMAKMARMMVVVVVVSVCICLRLWSCACELGRGWREGGGGGGELCLSPVGCFTACVWRGCLCFVLKAPLRCLFISLETGKRRAMLSVTRTEIHLHRSSVRASVVALFQQLVEEKGETKEHRYFPFWLVTTAGYFQIPPHRRNPPASKNTGVQACEINLP